MNLQDLHCEKRDEEAFTKLKIHSLMVPWSQIMYTYASHKLSRWNNTKAYNRPKRLLNFLFLTRGC